MAAQETSALFSLSELMRLEQNRIAEEEEQRTARVLAEENARREAERLAREQERVRQKLEEDRRREETEREREHAARLEAIREAEVLRVRVEAEQRARLEAQSAQQQHEQKLLALQTDAGKRKLSRALRWTVGLSAALIVSVVAVYFGRLRPETRDQVQSFESLLQVQRLKSEANQRALDAQNQKIKDLEERVRQQRESPAVPSPPVTETKKKAPAGPIVPNRNGTKPAAAPAPCGCDRHDPLCGCFER
jgi:colicin import membrane protein